MDPELNATKMMSWFRLRHEFCKLFNEPDKTHCILLALRPIGIELVFSFPYFQTKFLVKSIIIIVITFFVI